MTVLAIPFESIESAFRARHFDDHTDAPSLPLRRMPHVLRQKKNVAFFDWDLKWRFARTLHNAEENVSLELVEEFLCRIIMIVTSLVGAADYGHHHFPIFPHLRIANRRLELFSIFFNPCLEIERF